jgi:hypothetical protein
MIGAGGFSMHRLMAAVLICSTFGIAQCNSASGAVQGFYRVSPNYGAFYGFYHQYPYTLFGYPNYHWGYYPIYREYPQCDFVWSKRSTKSKTQHGTWTCP